MKIVFCGTPQFAVPSLAKLHAEGHELALVVTQPDRPRGRGMELALSPVKQKALELGVPVAQPEKIKDNAGFRAQLEALAPEAIVVVGYGRIIPHWMLALPKFGNINLHASLLPKYRGAAPIQWAIANGESVTGNTTMLLNEGLDTGDILLQKQMPVQPGDTSLTLAPPLAAMGADLLLETLQRLADGSLAPQPQEHSLHTLAPILSKDDGRVKAHQLARAIHDRFRGFQPWPGIFASFRGKQFFLREMRLAGESFAQPAGTLVAGSGHLYLVCAEGSALELLEVQMEGKKRMTAVEFLNGYRLQPGEGITF